MGLAGLAAALLTRARALARRGGKRRVREPRDREVFDRIARDRAIGYDTKTMDDMQRAGGWPGTR